MKITKLSALLLSFSFINPSLGLCQTLGRAATAPAVSSISGLSAIPALAPSAILTAAPAPAAPVPLSASLVSAESPSPSVRLEALSQDLAPALEAAAKLESASPESAGTLGRGIINTVLGVSEAVPAAPENPSYDVLGKLGTREKILTGGGVTRRADGTIAPLKEPLRVAAFDNDDNLVYYRTKIYVRHKTTHAEHAIPTSEFAEVRPDIGKRGKYQDYEYFDTNMPYGGSFRDFRDVLDPQIFIKDIADAMTREAGMWRAPSWYKFATFLNDPKTAAWAAIVTSRGHRPANMVKAFELAKSKGYLKGALREELIFGVSTDEIGRALPAKMGTPEKKVEILIELLDLVESIPLENPAARHSFGFSDDDLDMITRVKNRLAQEQSVKGRWPHIRVSLFATGLGTEETTVLTAPAR